ncbi:3-sulfolactaldehyde reductase [compost metagenome]
MHEVTVIGLGSMGSTLARLLLDAGYRVTVWNRSADKAEALLQQGARLAESPAASIAASPVSVVCVHDYKATAAILDQPSVTAVLDGKTLIQLTTISPQEAQATEDWAKGVGAHYLDGAIQAAPSQMGREDTPLLVSGERATYERVEALLQVFAAKPSYLGASASAASTMDLATLSYIYGASLGVFHGARICEAAGISVELYGKLVAEISPSFGAFLQHEAGVIHRGDFSISESPLSISVEATARLAETARQMGINSEFPRFAEGLLQRAEAAGYAGEEFAALIKVLRQA